MNARIITNGEQKEFKEWEDVIRFLSSYENKKQTHKLNITIYFDETFWQEILHLETDALLQFVYMFKEVEYKLSKMHQKYSALLLQNGHQ